MGVWDGVSVLQTWRSVKRKARDADRCGSDPGRRTDKDVVAATVMVDGYRALPASLTAIIRLANSPKVWRFRTCGRLYSYESLLERLAEPCEDVPPARRAFVQAAHALGRPRPLSRQRDLTAADQPHLRDGLVWGATRAHRHRGGFRNGRVARGVL